MKKTLFFIFCNPVFFFAQVPIGYYDDASGLTGYELKSKLHEIISAKTITWHYGDLPNFYRQTDLDQYYDFDDSNTTFLLDMYSANPNATAPYHYTSENLISSAKVEGEGYNREHMMPQSSFNSTYPMYSDLFFVIPTDAKINQLRSNYPYGMAGSTTFHLFTNGSRIGNNATPDSPYTGRVYEPIDEFKGDIARSLLYYTVRYEGKLNSFNFFYGNSPSGDRNPLDGTEEKAFENWYLQMLLQWHQNDPVSQKEFDRNNIVYGIQNNRNPFIDHPEWVNVIWTQNSGTITPTAPENLQSSQTSAYFIKLTWNATEDAKVLGYKIYQDGIYIGYSKCESFTVDHLVPNTNYQFTVKAYYNDYSESSTSNLLNETTLSEDTYAKDLLITKYLEGSENNKALEITNRTGHAVDLNKYRIGIQFFNTLTNSYYTVADYELEGVVENNSTFVILNPNSNFECITNDEAKFVSAAPQMTFTGNNYVELRYLNTSVDALGFRYADNYATLGDVSLYRSSTVTNPNTSFSLAEWQSYPADYCDDLGVLSATEVLNNKNFKFSIVPNPVVDDYLFVKGKDLEKIKTAIVTDMSGKQILRISFPFKNFNRLEVQKLLPGIYILQLDNQSLKFLKQ